MMMRILVVGGGIGGLCAAIALHRRGHQITLVERAPAFAPVGAGIVLAPNAARVLESLGVTLERDGHPLPGLTVQRADGRRLQHLDLAHLAVEHGPTWSISRAELHTALHAALPGDVELRFGASVSALHPLDREVRVISDSREESYDFVIGADGLHSTVREQTCGDVPTRYSGTTCYRGIVANPGYRDAIEAWGGAARIGVVPLSRDRLYYFLVHRSPPHAPAVALDALSERFGGFSPEMARLISALPGAPPLHHDLNELDRPVWSPRGQPRIVLLGDAAHAMTPNLGQGAAMAIEDAVALATALAPGLDGAVARYIGVRHRRVRAMQLASRRLGNAAHLRNPVARWAVQCAMRAMPARVSHWQYRSMIRPAVRLLASAEVTA